MLLITLYRHGHQTARDNFGVAVDPGCLCMGRTAPFAQNYTNLVYRSPDSLVVFADTTKFDTFKVEERTFRLGSVE